MSRAAQQNQWTAQQTLNYINGLLVADTDQDQDTIFTALSIAYQYLINATKRKITWSHSLQKLAYQFIDLAFQTNMHASVKDIFKSYRAITQSQYSQSLQSVLQHYRDNKLQTILEDEINKDQLDLIRSLPNIENEEPSPQIIFQSIDPDKMKREMQIRHKLKIVWQGYKSIVETVRVNQKLQGVYMQTLKKIFDFVERYNRVLQFKSFCKSLKTGLQSAFNKRDRSYIQKTIYIDIQKTDVNTRNIQIRMHQFNVAVKLELWGQAFSVLQDVNTLIRVRKTALKNSLKCQYFQNLALLFSRNNFWHYNAYAFYNYYISYLTKPRITQQQKQSHADKLLLSVLAIPAVTVESNQSKQIQQKLCAMMISSNKIPDRNQLEELMVSKGVLQNASQPIRKLWNFMFLEFGVGSLKKGLQLVSGLKKQYENFRELIGACLINKQLISIAEIYQRIRLQSLERLIPLPLPQIKKMLIIAHRQRVVDFTFDQSQGIIVFQDQNEEINPTQEFHSLFMNVALAYQRGRQPDEKHIMKKAEDYIQNAQKYIWELRQYKIQEFKDAIKKQIPELKKKLHNLKKQKDKEKQEEKAKRIQAEMDARKEKEQAQKLLMSKRIIIDDIKAIKENKVVRIMEKKVENLTDQEIQNIDIQTLKQHLQMTKKRINNNKEARLKKAFTHIDYLQRQRRQVLSAKVKDTILNSEEESRAHHDIIETARKNYHDHNQHRARLQNLAKFYKNKISTQLKKVYTQFDKDTEEYHTRVEENFKQKIIAKSKVLHQENEKKKQDQSKRQQEQRKIMAEEQTGGKWSFAKKRVQTPAPVIPTTTTAPAPKKVQTSAPIKKGNKNIFENLEGLQTKEEPPKKAEGKWGIGTKINNPPEQKQQPKKQEAPVEKPKEEKKDQKWGMKKIEEVKAPEPKQVFAPPPVEKKGKWGAAPEKTEEKKVEEKKTQPKKKGKGW